jgi:hypothetical protein
VNSASPWVKFNPAKKQGWWLRPLSGVMISIGTLWWTFRGVDLSIMLHTLMEISLLWIVVSLVCVLSVSLAKTARWRALYAPPLPVRFGPLFIILVTTQAINILIPIRVGEIVRVSLMRQFGAYGPNTLSTIIVEKVLDLITAGVVAVLLVSLALVPAWLTHSAGGLLGVSLTLGLGLYLLWKFRDRIEQVLTSLAQSSRGVFQAWLEKFVGLIRTFLAGFGTLANLWALSRVLWWTTLVWLLSILTMLAMFAAFKSELAELETPLVAAMVLMLTVNFSNLTPAPGLVGVIHLITVVVLGYYGISQTVAVTFGTVLNIIIVAPLILIGSWALWSRTVSLFKLSLSTTFYSFL